MKAHVPIVVLQLIVFLLSLYSSFCIAENENASDPSVQDIAVSELLDILQHETDIATKSNLNIDYVPGMVTVVYGRELQAYGVLNVREALTLVPGYQEAMSNGRYLLNVRGVPNSFTSGSIKYLLNGIEMNSSFIADAIAIFEIPISQVERIDVIRGPGSAVHGEFAYTGVVDITTKDTGIKLFNNTESYDTYRVGGHYRHDDPQGKWHVSLNVAGMRTDGADVQSGQDSLYANGMGNVSNAPGPANDDGESESIVFKSQYSDFSFTGQYVNNGQGDHYGTNDTLPPPDDRISYWFRTLAFEAKHKIQFGPSIKGTVNVNWIENIFKSDRLFINPPGFAGSYPDGMFASANYNETKLGGGLSTAWSIWKDHEILTGIKYSRTTTKDIWQEANYVPSTGAPLVTFQRFSGSEGFFTINPKRSLTSLVVQDSVSVSDSISATIGLHFDNYSDVGSNTSPRLAGVWRLNNNNSLKAQYARAFRPPTFTELYTANNPIISGNPNIDPQISDNYEMNYIFRNSVNLLRSTLFYSELKDVIVVNSGVYANSGNANLKGIEFEAERKIASTLKFKANFSYTKTHDESTRRDLPGIANTLLNTELIHSNSKGLTINVLFKSVSNYHRSVNDTRAELDGHNTFDLAVSIRDFFTRGITIRIGVKNIFDSEVIYPAKENTYATDYPQFGRYWWTSLALDFK